MPALFETKVYAEKLISVGLKRLNKDLLSEVEKIHEIDTAGIEWSKKNYIAGYTSYGSITNLHKISPTFNDLEKNINKHVQKYVKQLGFKMGKSNFWMNSCWINIMPKHAHHSFHIHPLSFISGTYYLQVPKGVSCIKFEDPRLGYFMNSPERDAFYSHEPKEGQVVLFESWLRHEVPAHTASDERISISFNYSWDH